MCGMRSRISRLIGAVTFSAIGFAALKQASPLVDQFVFTATLAALGLGALLAMHHRGEERAFWTGFALAGSLYLLASNSPEMEPRLITSRVVAELARHTHFEAETTGSITIQLDPTGGAIAPHPNTLEGLMLQRSSGPNPGFADRWLAAFPADIASIQQVGHGLFAWIAGWIGGIASRAIRARAKRKAWPGLRGH